MAQEDRTVVFIGASHAAAQGCISLRQGGWSGKIIVIGDEPHMPYHRPPLSKDYLSGGKSLEDILIRPGDSYAAANVDLKLGIKVTKIDRDQKTLLCDNGEVISYSTLVLTTGASVRRLSVPGEESKNVFYLRNAHDVEAIAAAAEHAKSAVIIGGGYIGLETAASLRKKGLDVTVLEAMDRILQRVTPPELSKFYKRVFTEENVQIHEAIKVCEIANNGSTLVVNSDAGDTFEAELVIIGIGVVPNTALAEDAGLEVGNGIVVNSYCKTSDPDIYAAGDVTWHYNPIYDTHLRLESVPNANEQAKTVAANINGKETKYNSLPWFWSDQFDLKLQIAGLSTGSDNFVIRGDLNTGRSISVFAFEGDRLLSVDAVNAPQEFMIGKMALMKGKTLNKAALKEPSTDLKSTLMDLPA